MVEFYNKELNFSSAFLFLRICIIPVNCFSSGLSTTSGLTDLKNSLASLESIFMSSFSAISDRIKSSIIELLTDSRYSFLKLSAVFPIDCRYPSRVSPSFSRRERSAESLIFTSSSRRTLGTCMSLYFSRRILITCDSFCSRVGSFFVLSFPGTQISAFLLFLIRSL